MMHTNIYLYVETATWVCEHILLSNMDINFPFPLQIIYQIYMYHKSNISNILCMQIACLAGTIC